MTTVLENIERRHRGIAETVDKDGFILALQKVEGEKPANKKLNVARPRDVVEVIIQVWSEREKEKSWDQKWAKVFDDKDGAPTDLGSWKAKI